MSLKNDDLIYGKMITPDMDFSGVYLIINLLNQKYYIGSAKDLRHRYRNHFNDLKTNKHRNIHLQRSYNKNPESFIMVMIEEVENVRELTNREQYWMDILNVTDKGICYNVLNTANSLLGFKHSKETKKKISEIQIGKMLSQSHKDNISKSLLSMEGRRNKRKIKQLSIDGKDLRVWDSASEASKDLNISRSGITAVCRGRRKTIGGFKWIYYEEVAEA